MASKPDPGRPEPAPEDVDDLDDLLDDFSTTARPISPPAVSEPVAAPQGPRPPPEGLLDGSWAQDLQQGMEELLKQYTPNGSEPAGFPPDMNIPDFPEEFDLDDMFKPEGIQKVLESEEFQDLMKNFTLPADVGAASSSEPKGKERAAPDANFQENIRKTLDKMRESGEGVKAGLEKEDDPMMQMLKALAGGDGSEDALNNALEGMMEQLLSRELLEEPMQALAAKYPDWLSKNRSSLPPADLTRYERQWSAIQRVLGIFHMPNYSDDNAEMHRQILDAMMEMQDCGAPPTEIMGEMPEGVALDPNTGLPAVPGCNIM